MGKAKPPLPKQELPVFCLDKTPVTVGEALLWIRRLPFDELARLREHSGSNLKLSALENPLNFVTWEIADRYCREHDSHLRTIAQWETAMRKKPAPKLQKDLTEWAEDEFPPAIFGYARANPRANPAAEPVARMYQNGKLSQVLQDRPWLSWRQLAANAKPSRNMAFRCAR